MFRKYIFYARQRFWAFFCFIFSALRRPSQAKFLPFLARISDKKNTKKSRQTAVSDQEASGQKCLLMRPITFAASYILVVFTRKLWSIFPATSNVVSMLECRERGHVIPRANWIP